MSLLIENQFITKILENQISWNQLDELGFESNCLKFHRDLYEWVKNYYLTNGSLPSIELTKTRHNDYEHQTTDIKIIDITDSLIKGSEMDRFYNDLRKVTTIIQNTQNLERALEFLNKRLPKYGKKQKRESLFDLTNDNFTIGKQDYLKRRESFLNHGTYGIPTGFGRELDEFLGGWQPGNHYGIVGKTGVSKTWLMLVSAMGAVANGKTPLIIGLESNIYREYFRTLTIATGVENLKLQRGQLDINEYESFEEKFRSFAKERNAKFYLNVLGDDAEYTLKDLQKNIDKCKPDIVYIDYLTLLSSENNKNTDWQEFLYISKKLAMLAVSIETPIPIVSLLQGVISSIDKEEMSLDDIAQSKGMSRDFTEILGVSKIRGAQNTIRINSLKQRDTDSTSFDALYQTGWNTGKIKFLEKTVKDGSF